MLKMGASAQKVTARKGKRRRGLVYLYQSDFSSGADNWVEISGVHSMGGTASVGGQNDALQIRCEAASGKAVKTAIKNVSSLSTGDIVSGNDYEVKLSYYIPSANDEVLYIESITLGSTTTSVDTGAVTTDAWLARTITVTASSSGSVVFAISMNEDHESGTVDQIYLKNISIREL
mgnify:CR=1 FL=1